METGIRNSDLRIEITNGDGVGPFFV